MRTSKEMQLKILNKMIENVENELENLYAGIQYKDKQTGEWVRDDGDLDFRYFEYRVKPETITINGVDIPKPLEKDDLLEISIKEKVYSVSSNYFLYMELYSYIAEDQGYKLVYRTKKEAIEASKLLFGIKQ